MRQLKLRYRKTTMYWKLTKTTPVRRRKGHLFRVCSSKGVSHHPLLLDIEQRQAGEWEGFFVEQREGSGAPLQAAGLWKLGEGS